MTAPKLTERQRTILVLAAQGGNGVPGDCVVVASRRYPNASLRSLAARGLMVMGFDWDSGATWARITVAGRRALDAPKLTDEQIELLAHVATHRKLKRPMLYATRKQDEARRAVYGRSMGFVTSDGLGSFVLTSAGRAALKDGTK